MSIPELTPEQIRTMTLEEKDRWWLKNVYKGDMPQLTVRSALTGMLLGGVLCLTNLYVGIRTGWTLGVGITSVILSFAAFKVLAKIGLGSEMTVLENNAMQSVATSAGYMTGPLISSMAAYMSVTGRVIPWQQTLVWVVLLGVLGVLFAFPLKKRFINDEQLPFPEGYAAGVVMDNLHADAGGGAGIFKAKILAVGALLSAAVETMGNDAVMKAMRLGWLTLPEHWDDFVYKWFTPNILGTPLRDLTIQWDSSIVMVATGGLMGPRVAASLMLGAIVNYVFLAPWMIHIGVIPKDAGFKNITMWALWGGVAMMTTASVYSFLSKPKMIVDSVKGMFGRRAGSDVLEDIELPMSLFVVGIPSIGLLTAWAGHAFFGVQWWLGMLAVPMVFVFTLIAVNATGLTSITPIGALGKLTQLTYGALAPGNVTTNLMAAGITGEVTSSAANLLMDIKPGYMLGGKPRHQAVGHTLGIVAGAAVSIPVFYAIMHGDTTVLMSDKLPMPGAMIWKAVAVILTKGFAFLHPTARWAVLIGGILGLLMEIAQQRTHGRFWLSPVGFGLAFILRFADCWAMGVGALLFWAAGRLCRDQKSLTYRALVENQETACAGVIAGGSIIGLILIVLQTTVLK